MFKEIKLHVFLVYFCIIVQVQNPGLIIEYDVIYILMGVLVLVVLGVLFGFFCNFNPFLASGQDKYFLSMPRMPIQQKGKGFFRFWWGFSSFLNQMFSREHLYKPVLDTAL